MEVKDSELSELLERLAATDAMFGEPTPTIRDVAEATDASPKLIARILGEMRGPTDLERIEQLIKGHEQRITHLEKGSASKTATTDELDAFSPKTRPYNGRQRRFDQWIDAIGQDQAHNQTIGFIIFIIVISIVAIVLNAMGIHL